MKEKHFEILDTFKNCFVKKYNTCSRNREGKKNHQQQDCKEKEILEWKEGKPIYFLNC